MANECRSCKAPVHWALTPAGARTPVDYEPDAEKGNMLLLKPSALKGELLAVVLSKDLLTQVRASSGHLFLNHWASCPDRAEWRGEGGRGAGVASE